MIECGIVERLIIIAFAVSILGANFAAWRMQKHSTIDGYSGPKWKLWFGDIALPKSTLSSRGQFWRWVSIVFFSVLTFSGFSIAFLNFHGSQCFGFSG